MEEETKKEEVAVEAPKEEAPAKAEAPKKEEAPADTGADVEVPAKFKKIVAEIEEMSVMELSELVKVFEGKFGVSASAVAVAGPASGGTDGDDEGPSTVTVKLATVGDQKIAVIKAVRNALSLGLAEAKGLVDDAPTNLKEDMKKEEAEALKKEIEAAGGTVEFV